MEDPVIFKQKKRKLALDSDNEDDGSAYVTTKSEEQKLEKPTHEKKVNGDDTVKAKNNTGKIEEEHKAAKKTEDKGSTVKSKPAAPQESKTNEKKDIEKKPAPKAKSVDERKKSETNGQQKKPVDSKTPPKKKRPVSESSESDESESESEEEEKKKKKKKDAPKPKKETPKKDKKPVVEKKTSSKDELIYDVLKRWWYALPEWPPANFDYAAELANKNLRRVDFKMWRTEPELDSKGLRKVYEVVSYPGVFKDSQGELIDLRPKDSCPSYANLKKKNVGELLELLIQAFKGQIDALEKSTPVDQNLLGSLKKLLVRAEKSQEMQKAREAQKKTSNK